MLRDRIAARIREISDFPKEGVLYKDISPILEDHQLCNDIVEEIVKTFADKKIDAVVGIESRGFLFGMMLAQKMRVPFITIRKKGKLPYTTISHEYDLEYGTAVVEMHTDAIEKGWNVLIHDDLLATGGTAAATAELVKKQEGKIAGFAFLIELAYLHGTEKIRNYSENIVKLVSY